MTKIPQFKTWNSSENQAWKKLSQRQQPNLEKWASRLWLQGFADLQMTSQRVPHFTQVSHRLRQLSGWSLVPTSQVFADGETWFQTLRRQELLVSDYIRPLDSLDYTPLPDVFHDAFGHVPFFTDQRFAQLVSNFTQRILAAEPTERKALGRIWWYTIEFGLINEAGEIKALGAGLISSFAELERAFTNQVELVPFDPEVMAQTENSPHEFHQRLFVLESLEELELCLKNWAIQT